MGRGARRGGRAEADGTLGGGWEGQVSVRAEPSQLAIRLGDKEMVGGLLVLHFQDTGEKCFSDFKGRRDWYMFPGSISRSSWFSL